MIVIPLTLFFLSDSILADGFESESPTGFVTFETVESEWDSYEYGFFDTKAGACNPEYFSSSPRMNSFELTPDIAELSNYLTADVTTDLDKAYKLFEYTSLDILYVTYSNDWRTPTEVLETMDGDCTDKSIVLVSLLEEAGIEAYVVYGGENELSYQHAWVVANINGEWFEMDATSEDFYSVYKCKQNKDCIHEKYYNEVLGVFGPDIALKCAN